jgi:curved DNA-binding protein CbpA
MDSSQAKHEQSERFREVVRANELLMNSKTRRIYDNSGYGWGDMNVNDIMGDPANWQGAYEGKYQSARKKPDPFEQNSNGPFGRAQPYYTSNANFSGGILVIMVLYLVVQLSHTQSPAQNRMKRRWLAHEQASFNLKEARGHARASGRKDMIEAFQQRRNVKYL